MKRQAILPLLGAILLAAICGPLWAAEPAAALPSAAAGGIKLELDPPLMTIGSFYAGKPVRFSGEIGAGQEVLLEMRGPQENVTFDLKGRVGPFWMNRGLVKVENAPILYLLLLPASAPAAPNLQALGLGTAHLQEEAKVISPGHDPKDIFTSFLEFKQAAGLYRQVPGAISYAPAGPGRQSFSAVLDLPSSLTAGQYQVTATVLQNGAPAGRVAQAYLVEDEAFLKLVKDLAFDRALLFGVLCVLIALVTGAVMGVLFKGGKGGH